MWSHSISAAEAFAPPYWANGLYEPGKSRTPGHPAAIGRIEPMVA